MRNKIYRAIIIPLLIIGIFFISSNEFHADYADEVIKLPAEASRYHSSFVSIKKQSGTEYAMQNLARLYPENPEAVLEFINVMVKYGKYSEYYHYFDEAGIPYSNTTTNSETVILQTQIQSQPASKTEFKVADITPYSAWATQDCNIRSGADTTYDKAGSLKQYEEVTVTGTASTGWFRITTSSGLEAYISNTLLTTEDPNSVTFSTTDDNGTVTEHTVEGENPEAVAEVVEKIKEGTLADGKEVEKVEEIIHEHSYASEVITEATCNRTGTMKYTCECGATYTEEIPMTEHNPGEWVVAKNSTLTSAGLEELACTNCGVVIESREIPANSTLLYGIIAGAVVLTVVVVTVMIKRRK